MTHLFGELFGEKSYRVLIPKETSSGVVIYYISAVAADSIEQIREWVAGNFGENTVFLYDKMSLKRYMENNDILLMWEDE